MEKYRWIVYLNHPMGGFELKLAKSIRWAKLKLEEYAKDTLTYEQASASLYAYSEEAWSEAMDYENIGCPFDHPAKVMEFGPKGGIRVINA